MTEVLEQELSLEAVEWAKAYRLRLNFSDGMEREVDLEPFLRKSRHPEIRKYLNLERFLEFRVVDGDLDWNDFELCFPIAELYEGRIAGASSLSRAQADAPLG